MKIGTLIFLFYLIFVVPPMTVILFGLIYGGAAEFHKAFIMEKKK